MFHHDPTHAGYSTSTAPNTLRLSDPEKWLGTKVYKGYFFAHGQGQEREFKITETHR
jgi:hypothetical protein